MGLVEDFKIVQEAQTIRILAVAADQQSLKDQLAVLIARDTGATSDELKALLVTATANLDALVALDDSTP